MSIIAIPPTETATIVCPGWCRICQADHISQLPQVDGSVLHYSETHSMTAEEGHIVEVFETRSAYTDGALTSATGVRQTCSTSTARP